MKKSYLIISVILLTLIMLDIAKATIPIVWQTDPNGSGVLNNSITRVKLTPNNGSVMVFHYNGSNYGIPTRVDKLDVSTGNFVWASPGYKTVTKPGERISLNGWVDNSGNLYIMPSWSGYTLWKYNSELDTQLWSYTGSTGFEYVKDVITDEFDNVYIAGHVGSGSYEPSTLVKLTNTGSLIWSCLSRHYTSRAKEDYTRGMALDSQHNLFRVGTNYTYYEPVMGRLIGHRDSDGAEIINYVVPDTSSEVQGLTIDNDDYIYIGYNYNIFEEYLGSADTKQERTVIQKLVRNGDTADVVWEYRFDEVGMFLPKNCIVKHTNDSFYVSFNQRQNGTIVPGIAEFDLDGNLLWKETLDKTGWNLSSIDAKDNYIYVGLTNDADGSQTQVLCLRPFVELLSPNGGENWIAGTKQTIQWEIGNANIASVKIELSANNGISWNDVNTVSNIGSYNLLVPQVTSNKCLIRISDANNSNRSDTSDNAFTIFECHLSSKADLDNNCKVDYKDVAIIAKDWLRNGNPFDENYTEPLPIMWIHINDPGVSGHEGFAGYMSKYETTNFQYCQFLNAALASGDIIVDGNNVLGASGSNSGADFVGDLYYDLAGAGYTYDGATNGGAARVNYSGGVFSVDSGFENHPVTYASWYGATAFCNYYGYRLPTEWEWQAVADYNSSYTYGCGLSINNSIANYAGSTHPDGTTIVGAFGAYGYGMCDMAGNVWEWTSSSCSSGEYVFRGGIWVSSDDGCTVSDWSYGPPTHSHCYVGFRVCR